jgi:RNA polymerase sigma factor for flagellar operon FliA
MLEPRFFPRADVDLPIILTTESTRAHGRLINLSEGGVLVVSRAPFEANERLTAVVELPTRLDPALCEGTVVRCERDPKGNYRVAIRWSDLNEGDAEQIRRWVAERSDIAWDGHTGRIPRDVAVRFIPLIRRLARGVAQRLPPQVSTDDLVGAGFVALVELYAKNPSMPLSDLERIAMPRLRWAMLDELRNADPLSRRMRQRARRIAKANRDLELSYGRKPTHAEVASHLKLSQEAYGAALRLAQSGETSSIETYDDVDLADSTSVGPEERMTQVEALGKLRTALDALPPRLKRVLELYYGDDLTLRQIGNVLGVTEARISQLLSDAVRRLRVTCASSPPPSKRPVKSKDAGGREKSIPTSLPPL